VGVRILVALMLRGLDEEHQVPFRAQPEVPSGCG
jgi:hypothetical protein